MHRIIINPIGGLANRMRAIASGISLARAIGADYSIIWSINSELYAKFEDVFAPVPEISDHIIYPSRFEYDLFYSIPRKKNLYITKITWLRFSHVLYDGMAIMSDEDKVFDAAKRSNKCFIQSGCIFYPFTNELYRRLFRPAPEVEKLIIREDMIGLHIRRTDNIESIKHSPDELFINKINEIIQEKPSSRFYLATDDTATKDKFKGNFGDRITTYDAPVERNTRQGIINAGAEMFTLANCSQIIGSHYSSYSEAAALLGNTPLTQLHR